MVGYDTFYAAEVQPTPPDRRERSLLSASAQLAADGGPSHPRLCGVPAWAAAVHQAQPRDPEHEQNW